ncbi:TPA: hypothetical protein ACH3X2_009694 [Trebouxia sp. C0005]
MGKKLKRGQAGNAVQYMTRTQAMRKLQVKLSVFRRLCILKGIHPREPKKKSQGQNKTYYHTKDISFLAHDPLLSKFRDQWSFGKKIKKARAKKNRSLADSLAQRRPSYRIDHLVKERYPAFVDALRDLDDPLTMTHLFATLPAESTHDIPAKVVANARRLSMEFQAYVVRAHALRKVFVSVKGFYYQADIQGQAVTWLVPHNLAQVLPADVDYRVMLTFLEFYQTLLQFVNFKLYHSLSVHYPPVLDSKLEEAAAGLAAIMQDIAQHQPHKAGTALTTLTGSPDNKTAGLVTADMQTLPTVVLDGLNASQAAAASVSTAALTSADGSDDDAEEDVGEIDSGGEDDDDADEEAAAHGAHSSIAEDEGTDAAGQQMRVADPASRAISPAAEPSNAVVDSIAGGALRVQDDDEAGICERLFKGLVFFLGREVPREQLLFVIKAFGGVVAWQGEGSPMDETDEHITHQIVDRPTQGHKFLSRQYVQPQWVIDSANFRVLAKAELYGVGMVPPPHLSPFVQTEEEGYVPDYLQTMLKLQEQAQAARKRAAGTMDEYTFIAEDSTAADRVDSAPAVPDVSAEQLYKSELAQELQAGSENEEQTDAAEPSAQEAGASAEVPDLDPEATVMMTRKQRGLYNAMQRGLSKKRQRAESLQAKAKKLKQPSS